MMEDFTNYAKKKYHSTDGNSRYNLKLLRRRLMVMRYMDRVMPGLLTQLEIF